MIGFESSTKLWFEGEDRYGYGLVPSPMVSLATVVHDPEQMGEIPVSSDLMGAKLVFREDSFDPVTRIRRGRLYFNPGNQPVNWRAHPHSFLPFQGVTDKPLVTFQRWAASKELLVSGALVALGTADAFTLWRVVGVERISTGDDLVTLRARTSLGLLPELDLQLVPERERRRVTNFLEKVVEAAYRAGPESVIDRCRDAAQVIISVWASHKFEEDFPANDDLSPLLDNIEKKSLKRDVPAVLLNAGRIIARLHARKPNEQVKRGVRMNVEEDAEVAVGNLGLIMRELGWAG